MTVVGAVPIGLCRQSVLGSSTKVTSMPLYQRTRKSNRYRTFKQINNVMHMCPEKFV